MNWKPFTMIGLVLCTSLAHADHFYAPNASGEANDDACAQIVATLKKKAGAYIAPATPALQACPLAQWRESCEAAKSALDRSVSNQGSMKNCMPSKSAGVDLSKNQYVRISYNCPGSNGNLIYTSLADLEDANLAYLTAKGCNPTKLGP